jgi:hypothetical protein
MIWGEQGAVYMFLRACVCVCVCVCSCVFVCVARVHLRRVFV